MLKGMEILTELNTKYLYKETEEKHIYYLEILIGEYQNYNKYIYKALLTTRDLLRNETRFTDSTKYGEYMKKLTTSTVYKELKETMKKKISKKEH